MFFAGGLIPTYLLIRSLGLMNSRWVLILPIAMNVYYIIVARNFLMTIDQSMEDSAIIDGAGYWTILLRIMVPLAKPVFVTVGLWAAVEHWNAWFDAMIYLDERNKQVLQLLIRDMLKVLDFAELDEAGDVLGLSEPVPVQSVQPLIVTILLTHRADRAAVVVPWRLGTRCSEVSRRGTSSRASSTQQQCSAPSRAELLVNTLAGPAPPCQGKA